MNDIYLRNPSDPTYIPNILEESDELENLLQKINLILFTKKGDVLGSFGFGASLLDRLFTSQNSVNEVQGDIMDQIMTFLPTAKRYAISIEIEFIKEDPNGTTALINVYVKDKKKFGVLVSR